MVTTPGLLLISLSLAALPLTEADREQLATAADGSRQIDEAALYPLLRNVAQWEPAAPRRAWVDPDYGAMSDDPAAHRGELTQVEGAFYGRSHRYALQRSGAWGDRATMWMLVVERDPERFAVVFLVDPEGEWHERAPRIGQRVQVTGRFYKLWSVEDERGVMTDYLAFVGRDPRVLTGRSPAAGEGLGPEAGQMALLLGLALAALLFVLWRSRTLSLKPRPLARQQLRPREPAEGEAIPHREHAPPPEEVLDEPALPEDPVAALDELSRARDQRDDDPQPGEADQRDER